MSDLKTKTSELESGTKLIRNKMPLTKHHEIGVHCLIMNNILVVDQVACPQLFFPYGILSISPAKIINNKEVIALIQNIVGQNIMVLQLFSLRLEKLECQNRGCPGHVGSHWRAFSFSCLVHFVLPMLSLLSHLYARQGHSLGVIIFALFSLLNMLNTQDSDWHDLSRRLRLN